MPAYLLLQTNKWIVLKHKCWCQTHRQACEGRWQDHRVSAFRQFYCRKAAGSKHGKTRSNRRCWYRPPGRYGIPEIHPRRQWKQQPWESTLCFSRHQSLTFWLTTFHATLSVILWNSLLVWNRNQIKMSESWQMPIPGLLFCDTLFNSLFRILNFKIKGLQGVNILSK